MSTFPCTIIWRQQKEATSRERFKRPCRSAYLIVTRNLIKPQCNVRVRELRLDNRPTTTRQLRVSLHVGFQSGRDRKNNSLAKTTTRLNPYPSHRPYLKSDFEYVHTFVGIRTGCATTGGTSRKVAILSEEKTIRNIE